MKRISGSVLASLVLLLFTGIGFGQTRPVKKTPTKTSPSKNSPSKTVQDVQLEEIRIGAGDEVKPEQEGTRSSLPDVPMPELTFDTTSAPNDAFTKDITLLLEETGAVNLGMMFGKGLLEKMAVEQDPLMKEFYARFLKDLESGKFNKLVTNATVKSYRQFFTHDEVLQLSAFYKTPLGQKTIKVLPELVQSNMKYGDSVGRYYAQKIMHELIEEKKKSK